VGVTLLSPPTGINRFAFGDRFKAVFPNHNPATFWPLFDRGKRKIILSWKDYLL
jgi:hypothetical protein